MKKVWLVSENNKDKFHEEMDKVLDTIAVDKGKVVDIKLTAAGIGDGMEYIALVIYE